MLNTGKFASKTIIISGASRGIGRSIALKLAKDKANIAVLAKTAETHAKLPGTIYTVAEEIEKVGGNCLPIQCDIRDEASVESAVEQTVKKFGGIDVCVNNASAISLTGTLETPMKRYDLMHSINVRGTFLLSKQCIPYLKQAKNPHILTMSPPLNFDKFWLANHVAYTISKYGMSMCTMGMAEEFLRDGIAVNSLWPQTTIWTAAMEMISGTDDSAGSRTPEVIADAAYAILSRRSKEYTGNLVLDEQVLAEEGVTNFDQYACKPGVPLNIDLFIPGSSIGFHDDGQREKSRAAIKSQNLDQSIELLKTLLKGDNMKKLDSVYVFEIQGDKGERIIWIDTKNKQLGEGTPDKFDVVFRMNSDIFVDMLDGKIKPSNAFVTQKLKITGNFDKALKLASLLDKLHNK